MVKMKYTEAFARFGAKLTNPQWGLSAIAPDGTLVVALSQEKFTQGGRYVEVFSRANGPGYRELRQRLRNAFEDRQRVRAVVAYTEKVGQVDAGVSGSEIPTNHVPREDVVGTVTHYDGEVVVIEFHSAEEEAAA